MTRLASFAAAICGTLLTCLPAAAQQQSGVPVLAGESAFEYAERVNACDDREIVAANFTQGGTLLEVQCRQVAANGMSGGLSAGGVAVAVGVTLLVIALAANSGSGGNSTPSTD